MLLLRLASNSPRSSRVSISGISGEHTSEGSQYRIAGIFLGYKLSRKDR